MRLRIAIVAVMSLVGTCVFPGVSALGNVATAAPARHSDQRVGAGFNVRHIENRLRSGSKPLGQNRRQLWLRMAEGDRAIRGALVEFHLRGGKVVQAGRTSRSGLVKAAWRGDVHGAKALVTYLSKHYAVRVGSSVSVNGDPSVTSITSLDSSDGATLNGVAFPGRAITVTASGFPGLSGSEPVDIYLDSRSELLGTSVAAGGTITATVSLPTDAADALHTVVAIGDSSGAGGTAGVLIFTGWDGIRGDLTAGTASPNGFNSLGSRAQLDEHTMSADRMAGGTLVQLGGFQSVCGGSPTWTLATTSTIFSRPTEVLNIACVDNRESEWFFDRNAGNGVADIGVNFCVTSPAPTASPAISTRYDFAGVELFGADDGNLYAVSNTNGGSSTCGVELSTFPASSADPGASIAAGAIRASPDVEVIGGGDYAVFASENGTLHAVCFAGSCTLGSNLFPPIVVSLSGTAPASPIDATPLCCLGDLDYVASTDGRVYGYFVGTLFYGPVSVGSPIYSSPIEYDSRIYFGADNGDLYCYSFFLTPCSDWTVPSTGGAIRSTAAVANGTVYVTSESNHVYAFDAITGSELWSAPLPVAAPPTGEPFNSSPAYADGVVYVGGTDGNIYAFYASNGQLIPGFPKSTDAAIYSSPAIGGGFVAVGNQSDEVSILTPEAHGLFVDGATHR